MGTCLIKVVSLLDSKRNRYHSKNQCDSFLCTCGVGNLPIFQAEDLFCICLGRSTSVFVFVRYKMLVHFHSNIWMIFARRPLKPNVIQEFNAIFLFACTALIISQIASLGSSFHPCGSRVLTCVFL